MSQSNVEQLRDPGFWRSRIGLSPIPLHSQDSDNSFVLMNGAEGNFCLRTAGECDENPRSLAWSSDVGHHLTIRNQSIEVVSWYDRGGFAQSYRIDDVASRISDFHMHLEKTEPNRDGSIVAHALRVLGQMRQLLPLDFSSEQTIRYFLTLLARGVDRNGATGIEPQWLATAGLPALDENALTRSEWELLLAELSQQRSMTELSPLVGLMLRHASGTLFQEVHYRIRMPLNLSLPGIAPPPAKFINRQLDKQSGVYFTPPFLARTLVEEALAALGSELPQKIRAFDPACGSGEFFKELIRQLSVRSYSGELEIEGWDNSDVALNVSRFTLAFEKANPLPFTLNYRVMAKDSILCSSDEWPKDVDLVLMNPPFAAWSFLSDDYKTRLNNIFASGKPNLAVAFAKLAADTLRRGGIFAAVLPASVLDSISAKAWRETMATCFTSSLIAKLGSQSLFSNAIVDANLAIFMRDGDRNLPCRVVWADQKKSSSYKALRCLRSLSSTGLRTDVYCTPAFSVYADPAMGRSGSAWRPTSMEVAALLSQFKSLPILNSLFNVEQGARTGEDAFILPKEYVKSLNEDEQRFFRPAVVNASIRNGRLNDDWYVWFPYSPGLPEIQNEEILKQLVPTYYADKLIMCEAKRAPNLSRQSENRNWWELIRKRNRQMAVRPKIVSTYFGGSGSFAYDAKGDFVAVVGYFWVPHKVVVAKITDDISYAYIAITCSTLFGKLLEAVSTHIGGGQLKLEKQFLAGLPIPDLTDGTIPIRLLRALSNIGRDIALGKEISQTGLDNLVDDVYSA